MQYNPKANAKRLMSAEGATSAKQRWEGGPGTFGVWGTFGGTTADLEVSFDAGTTWQVANTDGSSTFTAAGGCNFDLPICDVRVLLTGGAAISLTADVRPR